MNQIVFLVDNQRCGYCRKFAPVIESNLRSMNDQARQQFIVDDKSQPDGGDWFKKLEYRGGIPCVALIKDGQVAVLEPGYKDTARLAPMLAKMYMS